MFAFKLKYVRHLSHIILNNRNIGDDKISTALSKNPVDLSSDHICDIIKGFVYTKPYGFDIKSILNQIRMNYFRNYNIFILFKKKTDLDQGHRGFAGGDVVEVQEFHLNLVSGHLRLPLLHMIRMMKVVAEKIKKRSNLIYMKDRFYRHLTELRHKI